jgi:BolA family transcriptional regulator, general stress-responsive regulator
MSVDVLAPAEPPGSLGPVAAHLYRVLHAALGPTELAIRDDSHLHAGHAGAREGGHFHLTIRSGRFAGLMPLRRHRLIYDALGPLAPLGVHALSIDARPPLH